MKLFQDINVDTDITLSKPRKTGTNNIIIDLNSEMYQTCWLQLINDVENNICVDATNIKDALSKMDQKIFSHALENLEYSEDELKTMYNSMFKLSQYFVLPINTTTVLFCNNGDTFDSSFDIKNNLKKNDYIRCIISFKKLIFKDYELKLSMITHQIEKA